MEIGQKVVCQADTFKWAICTPSETCTITGGFNPPLGKLWDLGGKSIFPLILFQLGDANGAKYLQTLS